jgi:hypothetical protein
MRFIGSRWRRIVVWAAILVWPALLPHPANTVAACIWYPVLGLSGLIYFLSRIQSDATERGEPVPPVTGTPLPAEPDSRPQPASRTPAQLG